MCEIIKILKAELKYDSATKREWMSDGICDGKPKINPHQCSNCPQLENQLKEVLKELSYVRQIMDSLCEEIKFLEHTSIDSNANNSQLIPKSRNSSGLTMFQPPNETHSTHITPGTTRYAVPVTNRYDALSNHHEHRESNDRIAFSKIEAPPRFRTTNKYKNVKEQRRNKSLLINQSSLPKNHQPNKRNLHERRKNEGGRDILYSNHSEWCN